LNQQHNGRAAQVGAQAELDAVTSEIMLIVRQLDALNRFRFRSDAESLAAWKSAREVAWPAPYKDVPPVGGETRNYRSAGSLTVHFVSNPPRTLYSVVTSRLCGSRSLKRSSAIRPVACSWKIPTLR
jgi:hypothetical protein